MPAKGNLTHLSYTFGNTEPLGTEFKIVTCSVTGVLILIEVKRVNEGNKNSKYHQKLGATKSCTKRMTEARNGIGQRYRKGATNNCFIFESRFYSKKSEESVMEAGTDLIDMVNTPFIKIGV